jgi:predicted molibdopterin-dependent oxidoreductase YjgC
LEYALTPSQPPPARGRRQNLPPAGGDRGGVTNGGQILYAQGRPDAPVNGEFTCVKGRYGWDFVNKPDRLARPLLRKDVAFKLGLSDEPWELPKKTVLQGKGKLDDFVPVSWDTATGFIADKLADIINSDGPDAVAGLTSARCTNEENYVFQKFFRVGIGTNAIDHCARL